MARLLFCVRKYKQGVCISHKFEAFLLYCFMHQTQFRVGAGGESGPSKVVGAHATPTGPGYDLSTDYATHV